MVAITYFLILSLVATSIVEGSSYFRDEAHQLSPIKKPRAFETEISNIAECLRIKIKNGIPSLGIQSLDPLKFPMLPLTINNDFITSSMIFTDLLFEGLAGFELKKGTITIPFLPTKGTLDLDLNFNKIKLTTKYDGSMRLFGLISLNGKGTMSLEFDNTNFDFQGTMSVIPLKVTKTNLNLILPATKITITGLFNDELLSKIISQLITDTLTGFASEENPGLNTLINTLVGDAVTTVINPLLANTSISDIINIIGEISPGGGGGSGCKPVTLFALN